MFPMIGKSEGMAKLGARVGSDQLILRRLCVAGLLWLALLANGGCSREFYREWANQDVSEAVFEKSRDPRWRLDMFTIEPPALSRYGDPYNQEFPPAPPDDYATQALSPVPQSPGHRLMVPAEGTGYQDMLENWQQRQQAAAPAPAATSPPDAGPGMLPSPPPAAPSPFAPSPNSGTNPGEMAPNRVPASTPSTGSNSLGRGPLSSPKTGSSGSGASQAQFQMVDTGVWLAAYQEPEQPPPTAPPVPQPTGTPSEPPQRLNTPPIGQDPNPQINEDLSKPVNPRPDLTREEQQAAETKGAEIAGIFIPKAITLNEAEAAGLPSESRPYEITIEQAFTLALINSRVYQFQLENIYLASLAVTLQRFAFEPQFFAGLSPLTGVAGGGFPSANPINTFVYHTKESPGGQVSLLNMGTVAGAGKLFNSGARLLVGFANQVVFNFVGRTPRQPIVQS